MHWVAVDPDEAAAVATDPTAIWRPDRDPLDERAEHEDGTPAERVCDLLGQRPSSEPGRYEHEVRLEGPRFVRIGDKRVAVRALRWVEKISVARTATAIGPRSPGVVLAERITSEGARAIRVVMDHELRAWRITDDGRLKPAGGMRAADNHTP